MRTLSIMLLWCCGIATGTQDCQAGGFFRRVPEVGEWATYEWSLNNKWQFDPKEPTLITEMAGLLTIKCVGEEVVDEQRHLWIECRSEITENEHEVWIGYWSVFKMLVPEDQIVDGELTSENVRGWFATIEADPVPLEFSPGDSNKDTAWFTVMIVFAGSDVVAGQQAERTVIVNDEEVQLSTAETGPLLEQKFANLNITGEGIWWPIDDEAFGIASSEVTYTQVDLEEEHESLTEIGYDLVATGTDAVSDLPNNN